MFFLKLIGKVLLIPLVIVLGILRLLVKVGMELSSLILGALILIIFGCIVFTAIKQTWDSMIVLAVMEFFLIMVTAWAGVIEGLLDIACDNLGSFMRL